MLSQPSFSSPLINEDLPAGPQLVFTLNNRFFRHQACYSLLPVKTGGQADRVISLCKYRVVALHIQDCPLPSPTRFLEGRLPRPGPDPETYSCAVTRRGISAAAAENERR